MGDRSLVDGRRAHLRHGPLGAPAAPRGTGPVHWGPSTPSPAEIPGACIPSRAPGGFTNRAPWGSREASPRDEGGSPSLPLPSSGKRRLPDPL